METPPGGEAGVPEQSGKQDHATDRTPIVVAIIGLVSAIIVAVINLEGNDAKKESSATSANPAGVATIAPAGTSNTPSQSSTLAGTAVPSAVPEIDAIHINSFQVGISAQGGRVITVKGSIDKATGMFGELIVLAAPIGTSVKVDVSAAQNRPTDINQVPTNQYAYISDPAQINQDGTWTAQIAFVPNDNRQMDIRAAIQPETRGAAPSGGANGGHTPSPRPVPANLIGDILAASQSQGVSAPKRLG